MKHLRELDNLIFPIKKENKFFCPADMEELEEGMYEHHISLDGRGTEGFRLTCPKCKRTFYEPIVFID